MGHIKSWQIKACAAFVAASYLLIPFQNCSGGFETEFAAVDSSLGQEPISEPPGEDPPPMEPVPAAPSNLSATVLSQSQISLVWSDNSNNETHFSVQRSSDGINFAEIATVLSGMNTYTATGLAAMTTFHFRVRAVNGSGPSGFTAPVTATTQSAPTQPTPQPPAAPTQLTLTVISQNQINLSWRDNSNNETGFGVERSLDGTNFIQVVLVNSANTTSYAATGLNAMTNYTFRVRAFNGDGNSAYSNAPSATTQSQPVDPPPVGGGTRMAFMAHGHQARTIMSCDGGVTWIRDRSDNNNARCWVDGPNYVECDHTPVSGKGIDAHGGWFVATYGWGYPGTIRRSRDGVTWENAGVNSNGIAYYNQRIAAIRTDWQYSTDNGASWRNSAQSPHSSFEHPMLYRAGDKFIAFGRANGLAISRDFGASWQLHPNFQQNWGGYFAEGNNLIVSVGKSGFAAFSRDNGNTWTSVRPHSSDWVGLVFNGSQFVGWTPSQRFVSSDGQSWTAANLAGVSDFHGPIQYNPQTQTYAAIPGNWGATYSNQRAYRSHDGMTWTRVTSFPGGHPITGIAVGPVADGVCP